MMRSTLLLLLRCYFVGGLFANRPTGQAPQVVYYSKVGIELSKLVFKGQNMTPP